jgi:hypothetical protein
MGIGDRFRKEFPVTPTWQIGDWIQMSGSSAYQILGIRTLCGELYRRLGNWDKARLFFERAEKIRVKDNLLNEWIQQQKNSLP